MSPSQPFSAFITHRSGIVHRDGCTEVRLYQPQVSVTPNQCLVYKLPPCTNCWASTDQYSEAIGVRRGRV